MSRRLGQTAVWCLVLSTFVSAQSSNATLGGTVTDSSGALIPAVVMTASNTQTGIIATVSANDTGTYQFASLQPGTYRVSATGPGFQTHVYTGVTLGLSQQVRLNFTLQPGAVTQTVEVNAADATGAATSSSSSVGAVLFEYSLRDLPLPGGNVLDLVLMTPGTQGSSFAGGRSSQINTTRDGISVNDGRYDNGVYSQTYMSTDLVDEMRIAIAPADAETGRGSGQVRLSTRSGTNQFRGSLFWVNRNSVLDASTWFNNFNRLNKDYLNRNQFGGRLGGPIVRNKTFFFVLFEGMRTVQKASATADALTADARRGFFRYFPGAQNTNAISTVGTPTVDLQGNPVRPPGAGPLTSFNIFGRDVNGVFTPWDPLRPGFDPSGQVQKILAQMPLPNDFTAHDALNLAHYRWIRRTNGTEDTNGLGVDINRNELNLRIDHHFNERNRLFLSGSRDHTWAANTSLSNFPGGYNGQVIRHPKVYTGSLVSSLSQSLVNEFRFGLRRGRAEDLQPYDVPGKTGEEARKLLGQNNGIPYIIKSSSLILNYGINDTGSSRGVTVPLYTYADQVSWTKGKHAFKGGAEFRFGSNNAWNSQNIIPRVLIGPSQNPSVVVGGLPVNGIDGTTIPGLSGADQIYARTLLVDLAGSVAQINQAFSLAPDPKNIVFQDYRELYRKYRDIHQNEWSAFFKDDWKISPNLTLNLGVRYEYYGVPYESHGMTAAPIGGGIVIVNGSDAITPEFVGKNSPQPEKQLYKDDWNNVGPAVGLSWSLPFFGKDKTVLRAGYGINYQGGGQGLIYDTAIGSFPGINQFASHREGTAYLNLTNISLPIPERYPSGQLPVVPLTARNDFIYTWDPNRVTPYIQNSSLEIQRAVSRDMTVSVRYIGTKGTKLYAGIPQNYAKVYENGLLDAFNVTRAGGDAPLFDQMLKGLVFNAGQPAVNGTTVTGSAALRQNAQTRVFLANSNIFTFAGFLNTTANSTGEVGGLLRNGGFPENFIVKNPQFLNAYLYSNPGNSTYHSMQINVSKVLSHGFSADTTYVWSRAIGDSDTDAVKDYLDPNNRRLDKSLLAFHRTQYLTGSGTFELPFGSGRKFLSNAPTFLSRLVERWQFGMIFGVTTGAPLNVVAGPTSSGATARADIVGDFPKSIGNVTRLPNGITYFPGLQLVPDPARASLTTSQGVRDQSSLFALADSQGHIILQNPAPGAAGTLGRRWFEGPGKAGMDLNLLKRVRIDETKNLELRVDAVNVLNHPQFGNPQGLINNTTFGRIQTATGNRQFTFNARVNF